MRIEKVRERINELMKERGWSKYRLATECKINESTIYALFDDFEKTPSLSTIQFICDGCGISLGEFFRDVENSVELSNEDVKLVTYYHRMDEKAKIRLMAYAEGIVDEYKED